MLFTSTASQSYRTHSQHLQYIMADNLQPAVIDIRKISAINKHRLAYQIQANPGCWHEVIGASIELLLMFIQSPD